MSYGVVRRCGSDLALLWLWCRLAAVAAPSPSLGTSICHECGLKKTKKTKTNNWIITSHNPIAREVLPHLQLAQVRSYWPGVLAKITYKNSCGHPFEFAPFLLLREVFALLASLFLTRCLTLTWPLLNSFPSLKGAVLLESLAHLPRRRLWIAYPSSSLSPAAPTPLLNWSCDMCPQLWVTISECALWLQFKKQTLSRFREQNTAFFPLSDT